MHRRPWHRVSNVSAQQGNLKRATTKMFPEQVCLVCTNKYVAYFLLLLTKSIQGRKWNSPESKLDRENTFKYDVIRIIICTLCLKNAWKITCWLDTRKLRNMLDYHKTENISWSHSRNCNRPEKWGLYMPSLKSQYGPNPQSIMIKIGHTDTPANRGIN